MLAAYGLERDNKQSHGCIYLCLAIFPVEGRLRLISVLGEIKFNAIFYHNHLCLKSGDPL